MSCHKALVPITVFSLGQTFRRGRPKVSRWPTAISPEPYGDIRGLIEDSLGVLAQRRARYACGNLPAIQLLSDLARKGK